MIAIQGLLNFKAEINEKIHKFQAEAQQLMKVMVNDQENNQKYFFQIVEKHGSID